MRKSIIGHKKPTNDRSFIDYVNERSNKAIKDMEGGKQLFSLKELQAEYGKKI